MDFIIQYIIPFWKFLSNFASTLNTNIAFNVNINVIYFLSVLVIIWYIAYVFVKYWKDMPDKQTLFIRVFVASFLSIVFVWLLWSYIKDISAGNVRILKTEGFISDDNQMSELDLKNKLNFYWIKINPKDIQKLSLKNIDWEEKTLYFGLYYPNNNLVLKNSIKFQVITINNGLNTMNWNIKVLNYDKQTWKTNIQISIKWLDANENYNIYALKNALWDIVIKDGVLLRKILEATSQSNNLFIVKLNENLYFNPYLVYKIAISDSTRLSLKQLWLRFPFLSFLLDNTNKNMFIYDWWDYYTLTFKNNSFLWALLSKYEWNEYFWTKQEMESKRYLINSYISNNTNSIGLLLMWFVYDIVIFWIKYLAYILYIFIPSLTLYFIKNIVKPEQI